MEWLVFFLSLASFAAGVATVKTFWNADKVDDLLELKKDRDKAKADLEMMYRLERSLKSDLAEADTTIIELKSRIGILEDAIDKTGDLATEHEQAVITQVKRTRPKEAAKP